MISVTGATGGFFFVELNTTDQGGSLQYSGYISYAALPSGSTDGTDVQSIINAMSNIYGGSVTVTRSYVIGSSSDYQYQITFPLAMGNVPTLFVQDAQLTSSSPAFPPVVSVSTTDDGNVMGGTFRLTFEGSTTSSLGWDATEYDVQQALQALPTVGALLVTRSLPSYQQTYAWSVTFASPMNSGYQPAIVVDTSGLTTSNTNGNAFVYSNVTIAPGNEIGGTFTVSYNSHTTSALPFNATAAVLQSALEAIPGGVIPAGAVSVSRSGPDGQRGYTWTVSFLDNLNRTFYGSLPLFQLDGSLLTGVNASVTAVVVRPGTVQDVQRLVVVTNTTVPANATAVLTFRGETTGHIPLRPAGTSCSSAITEVQTIATSTIDTTTSGGDYDVSMYLQFQLSYNGATTQFIQANPNGNGNCALVANAIQDELNALQIFDNVLVAYQARYPTLYGYQACLWTIDFVSSFGDLDQLQVSASNPVLRVNTTFGYTETAGDDTIQVHTLVNGQKDAFTHALELLPGVQSVTVTTVNSTQSASGACEWLVRFDDVAGDLPLLSADVYDLPSSANVSSTTSLHVTKVVSGTSVPIGGNFALTFRGARSIYLPYDADTRAMTTALQGLDTIGLVNITRSSVDPNGGYTWLVTFLTEFGSLDLLQIDTADMTGTVVTGAVSKAVVGVAPPFNSGNPSTNTPLGSGVVSDLTALTYTISNLEQGIAYYVRVAAWTSAGQGTYGFAPVPYRVPEAQVPSPPESALLSSLDSSSLLVSFSAPMLDGGLSLNGYKVEYSPVPFVSEVQVIDLFCPVIDEVQVVSSSTAHNIPAVQLVYLGLFLLILTFSVTILTYVILLLLFRYLV